jgi:osmotically-inducible protein OsmY
MAETTITQNTSARPDVDIKAEIDEVIVQYPPFVNDRHHVDIEVQNGAVTVKGHVRSPITRRYLMNNLPRVAGVKQLNIDALYDDESIRIQTGQAVPPGVYVGVEYGRVIITGKLAKDVNREEMGQRVQQIPGVMQVTFNF